MEETLPLVLQASAAISNFVSRFPVRTAQQRCPMTSGLLSIRLNNVLDKIAQFKQGVFKETSNCLRILVYTTEDLGQEFKHFKKPLEELQVLVLSDTEDLILAEKIVNDILFKLK